MSALKRVKVSGEGLKGQKFAVELSGVDVFAGPNGSGKTTRLLAITAGLRGLAESPTDSRREYIGDRPKTKVELVFEGRPPFVRDLSKTRGVDASGYNVKANEIAGPHLVRWDLNDFATDSPTNRGKVLDAVCAVAGAGGEWTSERVRSELLNGLGLPQKLPERHPLIKLREDVGDVLEADPGEWTGAAIEWARTAFTETNGADKRAKAKAKGMLEERAGVETLGTLADAKADRDEAQTARDTAADALSNASASNAAVAAHMTTGEAHTNAFQRAEKALVLLDVEQATNDEERAKVGDLEALKEKDESHRVAFERARERFESIEEDRDEAAATLNGAVAAAAKAGGAIEALKPFLEQSDDSDCCRFCGKRDPLGLYATVEEARSLLATSEETEEDASDDLKILERRLGRARGGLDEYRTEGLAANAALVAAQAGAERVEFERVRIATARTVYEKEIEEAEAAIQVWKETELPSNPGIDPATIQAQSQAAEAALSAANELVEKIVRSEEREAALQQAIADREAATKAFETVKALGKELKRIREAIATAAFEPIEEKANGLLEGEELRIKFRSSSDFGAYKGDVWICFWALSDSERALVGASIAYAFATLTGSPWRAVILDGLEKIDPPRLRRMLSALVAKVAAGELDNVIGALVASPDDYPEDHLVEGVTFHRLEVSP